MIKYGNKQKEEYERELPLVINNLERLEAERLRFVSQCISSYSQYCEEYQIVATSELTPLKKAELGSEMIDADLGHWVKESVLIYGVPPPVKSFVYDLPVKPEEVEGDMAPSVLDNSGSHSIGSDSPTVSPVSSQSVPSFTLSPPASPQGSGEPGELPFRRLRLGSWDISPSRSKSPSTPKTPAKGTTRLPAFPKPTTPAANTRSIFGEPKNEPKSESSSSSSNSLSVSLVSLHKPPLPPRGRLKNSTSFGPA